MATGEMKISYNPDDDYFKKKKKSTEPHPSAAWLPTEHDWSNPYLDDLEKTDYSDNFDETKWKNSIKQSALSWGQSVPDYIDAQKEAVEYNYKANAPDDKEGLAKSLSIWDYENFIEDETPLGNYESAWQNELSTAQSAHDKIAREQTELWNVLQYGIDNPDITGGLTEEAQSEYDFLKQYRVQEGGNPFVEGYGKDQWMKEKGLQYHQQRDQYFGDKQGTWTQEQLNSIDPLYLNPGVKAGDHIEGSFSTFGDAFTGDQNSEDAIKTLQRESKQPDWMTPETKPAGTNTVPFLLKGIPGNEKWKHLDNYFDPRDPWINKAPSSDETLIASANPNLKGLLSDTDTDTDAAKAEKQQKVIDENLGFGIARDWETTNNQFKDISTNAASLVIDPAKLPRELIQKGVRGAMDQLERVGNIDTPWDWADSALDTVGHVGRSAGAAQDALHGMLSSWGQQTGINDYTYDDPFQAKISDRELQRTAEATKEWADTLTRDQRVDLYNRQQAGERNRLTPDQYGDMEAGMLDESKQGTLNYRINKPAYDDHTELPGLGGQYNVLNNVQDVVWKELPTGQIVPSGLRDNWQLDNPSDFGGIGRVAGTNFNVLEAINTGARNIGRTLGIHNESNPNFAPQGYKRTDGGYQGTMRMPTMLDFGKYTPKATYTGQGQQKYGKNLMGISSNLISPSTGGGSSAMKIQTPNKNGFGY